MSQRASLSPKPSGETKCQCETRPTVHHNSFFKTLCYRLLEHAPKDTVFLTKHFEVKERNGQKERLANIRPTFAYKEGMRPCPTTTHHYTMTPTTERIQNTTGMSEPSSQTPTLYQTHYVPSIHKTRYLLLNTQLGALSWGEVDGGLRETGVDDLTMATLPSHALDVADFFPVYDPMRMTKTAYPRNDTSVFLKKQRILRNDTFRTDPGQFRILTRNEVSICELLQRAPHPNMAKYLGCETTDFTGIDRVTAIAYEKYDMNLAEYAAKDLLEFEQVPAILSAVENAMQHLHSLDIVHCDLQPLNIFLHLKRSCASEVEVEKVVLGDFDSALKVGDKIELKHATKNWWPEGVRYGDAAETKIDEHSYRQLKPWLIQRSCD